MGERASGDRVGEGDFHGVAGSVLLERLDTVSDLGEEVLDLNRPAAAEAMFLAAGRLRAALDFFRPAFEMTHFRGTRSEVRELEEVVGRRRGLDSSIELLTAVAAEMEPSSASGIETLVTGLDGERMEVNRELAATVGDRRIQALRVRIEDLLGGPEGLSRTEGVPAGHLAPRDLPPPVTRMIARRLARLRKRAPKAIEDHRASSRARCLVAATRLRFALELSVEALGGQADTARRAARGLQEVLVGVSDCDRTIPLIEREAERLVAEDSRVVRERARGARELDPVLVQAAPNRDSYRGVMLSAVDLRARREVEFERFRRLWLEQARQGVWVALEASLTGE